MTTGYPHVVHKAEQLLALRKEYEGAATEMVAAKRETLRTLTANMLPTLGHLSSRLVGRADRGVQLAPDLYILETEDGLAWEAAGEIVSIDQVADEYVVGEIADAFADKLDEHLKGALPAKARAFRHRAETFRAVGLLLRGLK